MEIERKFLVNRLPKEMEATKGLPIQQGYFSLRDQNVEIRLRQQSSRYWVAIKAGHGFVRLEEEIQISARSFKALWPLVREVSVTKTRHRIAYGRHTIEVDIYHGRQQGLITADVEFSSTKDAKAFRPPAWLGKEITGNRRYANQVMARENSS